MEFELTIGNYVSHQVKTIRDTIEKSLDNASGVDEWSVNVVYDCHYVSGMAMTDCLTVNVTFYEDGMNKKMGSFKFSSLEAIFLNEICKVMYAIISNPDDAEKILFDARVSLEFLQAIES
jgi:hypothetical protein